MKKSLIILLVLGVLLTLGLASCKNEVQAPADELVSVSFEQAVSRALTATLQEFKKENYYWYYAAKKADSTGLISGQTDGYDFANAVAVKKDGTKGLDAQVPGFSQGSWDFLLFAYEEDPEATGATITKADYTYWGEATAVTLKKRVNPQPTDNMVTVTVSPATTGKGTLFVDMEHIKLSEASSASHNAVAPLVSISCGEKTYEIEAGSNIKYKVDAGQWTVKVEYTDGDIIFATGTVIATVYPRLTTIVTGDVSELITYAQFDAKENPDLVKVTAGSTATAYDAIPSAGVVLSGKDEGETKTVSTTVAKGDAQKIMAEMATNAGVGLDSNTTMSLALNVDPTAATETSITYDISMSATLSVTQGSETKSTVKDVDKLDNVVIVEISMQKNLQDVAVTHSGVPMVSPEGASATNLHDGEYYYDGVNGKLYICTSSFSPFAISYELIEYAASLNGVKYETLAAAIAAVPTDGTLKTITLLRSISNVADISIKSRNVVLDLAGKTITMKATSNIDIDASTVTITGNGIINVDPARLNAAIEVHNNSTFSFLSGKLVVTNTTYPTGKVPAAYGIYLYNQETVNLGSKDTAGPTIECVGPCLATNGSCEGGTFNVYSGTFTSTRGDGDGDSNVIQIANLESVGLNTVNIYGGTFTQTGTPADGLSNIFELRYNGKKTIHIEGGVFNCSGSFLNDWTKSSKYPSLVATNYVFTGAVAYMNGHVYNSLQAAIDDAPVTTERSILVLRDVADGSGLITEKTANAKYLTIDFGGHTYVVKGPAVGSTNTATQAMHWGDGSRITLKNGSFVVAEGAENVKMGMQNYSALTIEDMTIDVSKVPYSLYPNEEKYGDYANKPMPSFNTNRGSLTLKNSTVTVNSENGDYGCNVGNSSLYLYGSQIVGAGVVLDEEGAMVITWDAVSTSSLTGHVKMYFPDDDAHKIGESEKDPAHLWILVPANADGALIGSAWPMEEGEDN